MPREDWFRIEADLTFVPTDEGGRRGPVASGYRPNCWFGRMREGEREYNDCELTFIDGDTIERDGTLWVAPGASCHAQLRPFFPQYVRDLLSIGHAFDVCEGHRVVARGTVLSIFDPGPEKD